MNRSLSAAAICFFASATAAAQGQLPIALHAPAAADIDGGLLKTHNGAYSPHLHTARVWQPIAQIDIDVNPGDLLQLSAELNVLHLYNASGLVTFASRVVACEVAPCAAAISPACLKCGDDTLPPGQHMIISKNGAYLLPGRYESTRAPVTWTVPDSIERGVHLELQVTLVSINPPDTQGYHIYFKPYQQFMAILHFEN